MRGSKHAKVSADRDAWTRKAFDASLDAVKDLISAEGPIRPGTPVGRLLRDEWGWIVSVVLWAWISTRSEQATLERWPQEKIIHDAALEPNPQVAGAIAAILPKLAETLPDLAWTRPIGEWTKSDIEGFLAQAFGLINEALAAQAAVFARMDSETVPTGPDLAAREINAAACNGLMTKAELDLLNADTPPF
jgi:hypothetical protein